MPAPDLRGHPCAVAAGRLHKCMSGDQSGRLHHPIWRFRYPLALLLMVLVGGTLGYMLIEGWDLLDSVFMTVITVSTVGYQTVHPLSLGGKLFSIALILVGVGTMLYSLGLFAELLSGGQLATWRAARLAASRTS